MDTNWRDGLAREGYALVAGVLSPLQAAQLRHETQNPVLKDGVVGSTPSKPSPNQRNLLQNPTFAALTRLPTVRDLVESVLGPGAFAVRGILFDKVPGSNWKVPWHQDLSIAVRSQLVVPGFGPWSIKEGVPHVQPPIEFLEQMLTVRLQLDDCGPENGPLRVLIGSHLGGRLDPEAIGRERAEREEIACLVGAGGAVIMRPLLLHASSPAASPSHRRVIHLEFAAQELPSGLEWWERVA